MTLSLPCKREEIIKFLQRSSNIKELLNFSKNIEGGSCLPLSHCIDFAISCCCNYEACCLQGPSTGTSVNFIILGFKIDGSHNRMATSVAAEDLHIFR